MELASALALRLSNELPHVRIDELIAAKDHLNVAVIRYRSLRNGERSLAHAFLMHKSLSLLSEDWPGRQQKLFRPKGSRQTNE